MQTGLKSKEWILAIVIMLSVLSTVANCQAQTRATTPSSQQMAADSMWKALSTTCPHPGGSSSTFFRDGEEGLIEYRDVRTSVFNWPLNKVSELNGIRRQGIAVLRAAAYRDYKPSSGWFLWDGPKEAPRDFSEAAFLKDNDHFEYYWPGTRVVLMEEQNGRWWFVFAQSYASHPPRPQTDKKDGFDATRRLGWFDLGDLQGSAPPQSCAELTSANPVKPPVPVVSQTVWRTLSSYRPFMSMTTEQFRKAPTWKSDHQLAAQLEALALKLDDLHAIKSLPPRTRYRVTMVDGQPIVLQTGTVVELEDGRVGLMGL